MTETESNTKLISSAIESKWSKTKLPTNASLQQAICNLNETAMQVVLVVLPDDTLVGTVTDGDIRRALLRGLDMNSCIEEIMHRDPLVVPKELDRDTVLQLMYVNKIHQIPVVDVERRVIGLHLLNELTTTSLHPNLMVIMAGGQGLRLRPHTENCPKPMLLVGGKPILEHIIERAKSEGFCNFVFAIHYLGHIIEDYFGDGSFWNVKIDYLREDRPLGTAGAIALLNPTPELPFLISNGDVLTDIRYAELLNYHVQQNATATMAVRQHEWKHPFGVVQTQGVTITGFEEKPVTCTFINAGIYVLEPASLAFLDASAPHCDMPILFDCLRQNELRTVVYPIHETWLDVGEAHSLAFANANV